MCNIKLLILNYSKEFSNTHKKAGHRTRKCQVLMDVGPRGQELAALKDKVHILDLFYHSTSQRFPQAGVSVRGEGSVVINST